MGVTLGLYNVLVGIFVQRAADLASISHEVALAEAFTASEENEKRIRKLYDELKDVDDDGRQITITNDDGSVRRSEITRQQIEKGMQESRVKTHFDHLGIDVLDSR